MAIVNLRNIQDSTGHNLRYMNAHFRFLSWNQFLFFPTLQKTGHTFISKKENQAFVKFYFI